MHSINIDVNLQLGICILDDGIGSPEPVSFYKIYQHATCVELKDDLENTLAIIPWGSVKRLRYMEASPCVEEKNINDSETLPLPEIKTEKAGEQMEETLAKPKPSRKKATTK